MVVLERPREDSEAFEREALIKEARRRQRRRRGAIALAFALVAGGIAAAVSGGGPHATHRRAARGASGGGGHLLPRVVTPAIHIPGGVVALAAGDNGVWVVGSGAVSRLDPSTARVTATIRTPGTGGASQIAIGEGGVWVTGGYRGNTIYRIDPATNRVVARIHLPAFGVAVGGGRVWVTIIPTAGPGELGRIDPRTNRVVGAVLKVGPGPSALVYGGGAVWVEDTSPFSVLRVDAATGRVASVPVPPPLHPGDSSIAFGFGSLWVTDGSTLTRFNPDTLEPIATLSVPRAAEIAFGSREVWVLANPRSSSPTLFYPVKGTTRLWAINAHTTRAIATPIRLNALQPIALASQGTNAWIGNYANGTVTRIRARK
jgi:streptogramin lyase